MSDIFICYSRTDSDIANPLAARLRAEGWSVFLDVQTHVGQRYDRRIEEELDAARAVIVLWSAASRVSHDVKDEARIGRDKNILNPAFIERVKSPLGFGHTQTADLIGWTGEPDDPGLAEMLESLRLHLNSEEPESVVAKVPTPAAHAPKPGETFRDKLQIGGEGPPMMVIPAGRFLMGSPPDELGRLSDEGPQHEVRIAQPFAIGVYAVTFDDYHRFAEAIKRENPADRDWDRENRPVISVTWEDARAYCAWLSEQTGRAYRLPSEAEWEYACRAGTTTRFHFGARITTEQANFDGNYTYAGSAKGQYREQTMPVGSFPPNDFGLYDMHGTVWEWCEDTWHDNYQGAPTDGSAWEDQGGASRVLRGGSWYHFPGDCRAAYRFSLDPGGPFRPYRFSGVLCRPHRTAGRWIAERWNAEALNTERRCAALAIFSAVAAGMPIPAHALPCTPRPKFTRFIRNFGSCTCSLRRNRRDASS